MDLARLREVKGLEDLHNHACTQVSPHVHPDLTHLSEVMEPAIEQVSDQVFNAVGFDVANATFVIGRDGVVVIDAMLAVENMAAALLAFREICEYPVTCLIYTHSHGDHWGGSPALVTAEQAASGEVPVIAQLQLMAEVARINGYNQPIMGARSAYQFGHYLDCSPQGRVNVGAGPFLDPTQTVGLVPPNTLLGERLEIEISGIEMEIVWVPSEAPDEIAVWLPGLGVLQTAECVQGECYPNLYTLRGDVPRPAAQWVRSLDVLRAFPADALAKSHGRSVVGTDSCRDHLRNYRDVMADGDSKWAIELLGYVVRSQPEHAEAARLAAEAHRREGLTKANATWRNWYLTAALELEGKIPVAVSDSAVDILNAMSVQSIVAALPVRLRAELTWYVEMTLAITVGGQDPGQFTLNLRRGVLEVLDGLAGDADVTARFADQAALVNYLGGASLDHLEADGRLEIEGDRDAAARFSTFLDEPPSASKILVTRHGPVT